MTLARRGGERGVERAHPGAALTQCASIRAPGSGGSVGGVFRCLRGADAAGVTPCLGEHDALRARRQAGPAERCDVPAHRHDELLARVGEAAGEHDDLRVEDPEQVDAAERDVLRGVVDLRDAHCCGSWFTQRGPPPLS